MAAIEACVNTSYCGKAQLLQPLSRRSHCCVLRVSLAAINRPLPCWTAGQLELRALSALISALESSWSTLIKPFLHLLITPARAAGVPNVALNTFSSCGRGPKLCSQYLQLAE